MREFADIVSQYHQRKKGLHRDYAEAIETRQLLNGDIDNVPTAEIGGMDRNAVPNLALQGFRQITRRIASTQPSMMFPPSRPGQKRSEEQARKKKQVGLGWWDMNRMKAVDRKRACFLVGYTSSPVLLRPDFDRSIPGWDIRDSLQTYPAPTSFIDSLTPPDCIFTFNRPLWWLRQHHPEAASALRKRPSTRVDGKSDPDELFELIEYIDAEEYVLGVLGAPRSPYDDTLSGADMMELVRVENRAGICTAVVPSTISLDRARSQYAGMIGLYIQQAKLQALAYAATYKGVFPQVYLNGDAGRNPQVIREADGPRGIVGVVKDGRFEQLKVDPGYTTNQEIDRLERYQRLEGGVPAEFGGESPSNVRTGRRGDAILSAVVDFPIQEAQEILAESKSEELKRAVAIDKGYFGNTAKSFYVSWKGAKGRVDYTPNALWDTDHNFVAYSHAGTDINGHAIAGGQRVGMQTLSKRSFMESDPLVEDAEYEHDMVVDEALEQALLTSLQAQAQQPGANVADYARIRELVRTNQMELDEAILQVQKEAQERQATAGPPGAPDGPVDPNSPEAQPGMAGPGMGAEAGMSPVAGLGEGPQDMASLLGSLRMQQMTVPSERVAS